MNKVYVAIIDFDYETGVDVNGKSLTVPIKENDIISTFDYKSVPNISFMKINKDSHICYPINNSRFDKEVKHNLRELTADEITIKDIIE